MDDFSKYEKMHKDGSAPEEVYLTGKADGLDSIALLRMLRKVCQLSLVGAKEVTVRADQLAASLDDFQEKLVPDVEKSLALSEQDGSPSILPANGAQSPSVSKSAAVPSRSDDEPS